MRRTGDLSLVGQAFDVEGIDGHDAFLVLEAAFDFKEGFLADDEAEAFVGF